MDGTGTVPILQKAINVKQKNSFDFNHTKDKKMLPIFISKA